MDVQQQQQVLVTDEPRKIGVVLVGTGAVGKSTLCIQASQLKEEKDSLFAMYEKLIVLEGHGPYLIALKDTQSGPELLEARKRAYMGVDVVFLVYSVIQPDSLHAAKGTLLAELKEFAPLCPIILVGNKIDMRDDVELIERLKRRNMAPVTTLEGEKAAQAIGALGFFEISCTTDKDPLERVFREGLLLVFGPGKKKGSSKKSNRRLAATSSTANSNNNGGGAGAGTGSGGAAGSSAAAAAAGSGASGSPNKPDTGSMRGKNCILQ